MKYVKNNRVAFCESMLEGFDETDREKALGDVRA